MVDEQSKPFTSTARVFPHRGCNSRRPGGSGGAGHPGCYGGQQQGAVRAEESVTLLQLARSQVEAIQQSPFKANAAEYPSITGIPEGFSVTFIAADSGIIYTYPAPLGTTIIGAVQKITVTAQGDFSQMSLIFYKVRLS
ncbi:MAG: hypothetical protein HW388_1305 [Dehalococcoidia bacterium]|nr:hypothetical protein [Dehalococcoidia bacterium]